MQRVKRIILLSAFVGATGVVTASPALAGPPEGGCPGNNPNANQWEVVTVQSLVDQGLIISGAGVVDLNGNGLTCVMFPPGQVFLRGSRPSGTTRFPLHRRNPSHRTERSTA